MKTVTTFSVWILAHPPCKAPTQSTATQGPVSPVIVLSVGSDCGELLLNPAEGGEETEESEWVCRKVERSLFRCSRFLRTACYFHTRGRTKANTLLSDLLPSTCLSKVIKPNTAAHSRLVGVAIRVRRVDGSSNRLHPFLIFFFFFCMRPLFRMKEMQQIWETFCVPCTQLQQLDYLEWTSAAKTIKTGANENGFRTRAHAIRQDADKKKKKGC